MHNQLSERPSLRSTGAGELFQVFRDGLAHTKSELATITGQSRSTITSRVETLLRAGLIEPVGEAISTGGRPPASFAFNPRTRVVLAVDLGASHGRVAVTDLTNNILRTTEEMIDISDGPEAVLSWVANTGKELLHACGYQQNELLCIGAGLPGPVQHSTGTPVNPPIMPGWDGVDVPRILTNHLDVPAFVDNDVNIMALGEHRLAWLEQNNLLFVKVSTGIGAGIILDGNLRRGEQGAAGDIGHISPDPHSTVPCMCGNLGCLEAVAGGRAVAMGLAEAGVPAENSTDVVNLAKSGNPTAIQAVREAGRDIGAVLASVVSVVNPSIIVVGGLMAQAGEHLIAGIREVVYSRSLPLATQHLRIVTATTGSFAGVLGASAMAIDKMLSPTAIDALTSEGIAAL